jgi:hypothetical protein
MNLLEAFLLIPKNKNSKNKISMIRDQSKMFQVYISLYSLDYILGYNYIT